MKFKELQSKIYDIIEQCEWELGIEYDIFALGKLKDEEELKRFIYQFNYQINKIITIISNMVIDINNLIDKYNKEAQDEN